MEQMTALLQQLATKLGTTVEYLWAVLVRQAAINATIDLIQVLLIALFGVVLWKTHKKLAKKIDNKENNYSADTLYGEYEEIAGIPMVIGLIAFVIFAFIGLCLIGDIINGYFNPEYWALQQVLKLR